MEKEVKNILEKTDALYNRYGIRSVTMDDVAQEIGISKRTLYQHFSDKADLIQQVIELSFAKLHELLSEIKQQNFNAIEELLEVNKIIGNAIQDYNPSVQFDLRKYYPAIYRKLVEFKRNFIYRAIVKNMEKGKTEGLYRSDLQIDVIAKLQTSRFEYVSEDDTLFTKEEIFSKEVFREIFIYHLRGICSAKGIEFLEEKLNELKLNSNA